MRWGFMVRAYDQRGHGESGGARGALPLENTLLDDLAEVVDFSRGRCLQLINAASAGNPGARSHGLAALPPLILMGHSLGGLVASRFVALSMRLVEGLVLSSPAFDAGLGLFQKILLKVLPGIAPNLRVGNGLDANFISRDPLVVQAYLSDRRVHNKISPRLGHFIATAGPATLAAADEWRTPTLLMYAGADKLVNPAGSQRFAQRAAESKAVKPGTVTAKCFDGYYHELFNEVEPEPVFELLKTWLDDRF